MKFKTAETAKAPSPDYSGLLRSKGIKFKEVDDHYYQVGTIKGEQGWILHISVVKRQITDLYTLVLPVLIKAKVPFKLTKSPAEAEKILSGSLGYKWLGKILRIYPHSSDAAVDLAKELIYITSDFVGPVIPTDSRLTGCVYTRFGAFNGAAYSGSSPFGEKYIRDTAGQMIPDPNNIPFAIGSRPWPFGSINKPSPLENRKTLHNQYMVQAELRKKPKGRVVKALKIKGLSFKSVIIKESKYGMYDEIGRDLAERLKWQEILHNKLKHSVSIPQIYELFEEDGNTYLAMERIKGQSLSGGLSEIYKEAYWKNLTIQSKEKVLIYILEVISLVQGVHQYGIVHRDITPENFLIDKNGHLVMIDLELAYDTIAQYPSPAYRLGTVGYMSPEQRATSVPTVKEDIYSIGALMIICFTTMGPAKFNTSNVDDLISKLKFFIDDDDILEVIALCLNPEPEVRPALLTIKEQLNLFKQRLRQDQTKPAPRSENISISARDLKSYIERSLESFANETMAFHGKPWHSNSIELKMELGNKRTAACYYPGFHTGVSGGLWMLGQAKSVGITFDYRLSAAYDRNHRYIQSILEQTDRMIPGLYHGLAGIAIATASGMNVGLIRQNERNVAQLRRWLLQEPEGLSLARGSAGQGLAILHAIPQLGKATAAELLSSHVSAIVEAQQRDGSWIESGEKKTGLSDGIAGIVFFLAKYVTQFDDNEARKSITRALKYLQNKAVKIEGKLLWSKSNKNSDCELGLEAGFIGITIALLNGHKSVQDKSVLATAEEALLNFKESHITSDLSLANGISGMGEMYLQAYEITGNINWLDRACWLAKIATSTSFRNTESNYWVMSANQFNTADLFFGNSGPLVFLIRLYKHINTPN